MTFADKIIDSCSEGYNPFRYYTSFILLRERGTLFYYLVLLDLFQQYLETIEIWKVLIFYEAWLQDMLVVNIVFIFGLLRFKFRRAE